MDTMLRTIIDVNLVKYTLNQTSANIDAIINGFEDSFGEWPSCSIEMVPAKNASYKPDVLFTPTGSVFVVYAEMHFKNPMNLEQDVADVLVELTTNVTFSIGKNFKL